MANHISTKLGR